MKSSNQIQSEFSLFLAPPKIASTGKILLEIEIPAKQVTSVAFGGPDMDILFVTTAATTRDGEQPPLAGHLFKVTGLGAKGFPGVKVRVWVNSVQCPTITVIPWKMSLKYTIMVSKIVFASIFLWFAVENTNNNNFLWYDYQNVFEKIPIKKTVVNDAEVSSSF